MKKVQGKKKRDQAAADALRALQQENAPDDQPFAPIESGDTGGGDLLVEKDEDIIF